MAIYVDDARIPARVGRLNARWSHLMCDGDLRELHRFAARIGLRRAWFQGPPDHRHPHYDLTESKRLQAVSFGAVEITSREAGRMLISGALL